MPNKTQDIRWRLSCDAIHTSWHPSGGQHDTSLRNELVCADSPSELQALVALMLRRWEQEQIVNHGAFTIAHSITYYRVVMSSWRRSEEQPGSPAAGLVGTYSYEVPTTSSVITLLSMALESFQRLVRIEHD